MIYYIDLQLMLQDKIETEVSELTSNSSQNNQNQDLLTPQSSTPQQKHVPENQKPIIQPQDKIRHLFPSWTVTKSITKQKIIHFYPRKPFIRQIEPAYQSRKCVELTQDDLIFIQTNKQKFMFEDVEILNEYFLQQFLQLLRYSKKQGESVENIGLILRKWIQSQEIPLLFAFCSAFQAQSPQKFEQFVVLVAQHCHYNFIKYHQFQTYAFFYKFKLFQDRQLYSSAKKSGRKPPNFIQNAQKEQQKQREIMLNQVSQYSDVYSKYLKRKEIFFKNIKDILLIFKDNGYCDDQQLTSNENDWTFESLQQMILGMLKKTEQKSAYYDKEVEKKKLPQSNRNQKHNTWKKRDKVKKNL